MHPNARDVIPFKINSKKIRLRPCRPHFHRLPFFNIALRSENVKKRKRGRLRFNNVSVDDVTLGVFVEEVNSGHIKSDLN